MMPLLGIVAEFKKKFRRITKIHLWSILATSDRMHLHTFVDRERKHSKNGDEGVVLDVIQITGDPSAERTAPPHSTHVRSIDVSSFLIQQGGEERLMEIQQHDGVVVEVAGFQQGFAKRCGRREVRHGREREAPGLRYCSPPSPHYI